MSKTQAAPAGDEQEAQLDQAIEDLRTVLREGEGGPDGSFGAGLPHNAQLIMDIPVEVQIVLGSSEMPVADLLALQKGSTVALDRRIGEPVDVVVNGRRIARGEITVLESDHSRFGVRLTEIVNARSQ